MSDDFDAVEPSDSPYADLGSVSDFLANELGPEAPQEPEEGAPVQAQPAVAPAAPPPTPEPAPDTKVAESLRELMAQERALQERRRELEQLERRLEPLRKYEGLERALHEEDAEGALRELGLLERLDDLNRAVVEGRGMSPNKKLQDTIDSKLQEMQKAHDERMARLEALEQQRLHAETVSEIRTNLKPETAPLTMALGDDGVNAILAKFQDHFARNPQSRAPSYEQVIGEVEQELSGFVDRLLANESVRQRYLAKYAPQSAPKQPRQAAPTLTNREAAEVAKRPVPTKNQPLPLERRDALNALFDEFGV